MNKQKLSIVIGNSITNIRYYLGEGKQRKEIKKHEAMRMFLERVTGKSCPQITEKK